MESVLEHRARVGVPDAILLEDYTSEDVFLHNLRKRYDENVIYTYIGHVLVALNPYRDLGLYTDDVMEQYRKANFYQVPPSVFAIAEAALRSMIAEREDQCVLISGESGAGKTEASKQILRYLAAATLHSREVDSVRDRLLQSNPVLEAFGNAKTCRNDNSSRFGKYMDVECNFKGDPLGGHILNYLLEKSRVVHQEGGERNFHVFYQLVAGADPALRAALKLSSDPQDYHFLRQGNSSRVASIDDAASFREVVSALKVIDIPEEEVSSMWAVVAAVLHLGNITFTEDEGGNATVEAGEALESAAELLKVSPGTLRDALTHRTIDARGDVVRSPLTVEQAGYCRDALAKATYSRLFSWLVSSLNRSLRSHSPERKTLFGILDIYGFEIFQNNGYEQFCINYCNEKLQQLFISLTLRSEQEEYEREGIAWEQVEYFDNRVICDLVEEKHKGIIALMDEECLRPGDATDATLLAKLAANLRHHKHFLCYDTSANDKERKTFGASQFRIRHYAGEVAYSAAGFLDKNNDLLYRDLKTALAGSGDPVVAAVFPMSELAEKKRPLTAATQFKHSLAALMDTLMSKQPSYVRCIKPNSDKRALLFDQELVRHQVQYLGLMENLRVRRAGFAYRRAYDVFLNRYKSLCPATWPSYSGPAKDGVRLLVKELGFGEEEYRMGVSKLFIRLPKTLFRTEDAYQARKAQLATYLQSHVKRVLTRRAYLRMRAAAVLIAAHWRRVAAQRVLSKRRDAAQVIRRFIKGFITRNEPVSEVNAAFQRQVKAEWLRRLARALPASVLDPRWPPCPPTCTEASETLRAMHRQSLAGRYVNTLSKERKAIIEEKILAETLFSGRKSSYPASLPRPFASSRLEGAEAALVSSAFESSIKNPGETTKYAAPATKYDRHGYAPRPRVLVLTSSALYLLHNKEGQKLKLKHRFPLKEVSRLVVSPNSDNFVLVQTPPENHSKDKGDLILQLPNVIEALTKVIAANDDPAVLSVADTSSIEHYMQKGKAGTIRFDVGATSSFDKTKDGAFVVIAAQ